jgi:mRNA-degrading endonuclease RelE of RelBE toxin-antitoxin system
VFLSKEATKQLHALPKDRQDNIKKHLRELESEPYRARPNADIKKLFTHDKELYRLRAGDYRAVYFIEGKSVIVTEIFHRSKGYDWIE